MSSDSNPDIIKLIMTLRGGGISDPATLSAIEKTPRHHFVDATFKDKAWENRALPIKFGQTISQPLVVALMTQALRIDDRCKVLEVGTGSGYQTAILCHLARRVYTIERYGSLLAEAEARLQKLRHKNLVTRHGDGALGWPEQAPFNRIIVTAAMKQRPDTLLGQLKDGGIMVAPVTRPQDRSCQELMRYIVRPDGFEEEPLGGVRFVPVRSGLAKRD